MPQRLYRSKPTEIEVIRWTGKNFEEIKEIFGGKVEELPSRPGKLSLLAGVGGVSGWVDVPKGHYIVCNPGDHTDLWPVDEEVMTRKYEKVEENQ